MVPITVLIASSLVLVSSLTYKPHCLSYPCLKKVDNLDNLDTECRSSSPNAKLFCYCCGGVQSYHIYGSVCNRYCLKNYNSQTKRFFTPCRLMADETSSAGDQNESTFDFQRPFP